MVIGVAAPHEAEVIAQLTDTYGTLHCPEVGVGERNVHTLKCDGMAHLAPVGVDHIGGGGHHGSLAELCHHLTPGEASLRTAGIFTVSQDFLELGGDLQRFLQAPASVGVQIHAGFGEGSFDGLHCLKLFMGIKHAALKFKVFKAILFVRCFRQGDDCLWGHSLLMAQAIPVAVGIRFFLVLEIGLFPVADVEEVTEEANALALNAIAH